MILLTFKDKHTNKQTKKHKSQSLTTVLKQVFILSCFLLCFAIKLKANVIFQSIIKRFFYCIHLIKSSSYLMEIIEIVYYYTILILEMKNFFFCGILWPLFFQYTLLCLFIDTTSFTFLHTFYIFLSISPL